MKYIYLILVAVLLSAGCTQDPTILPSPGGETGKQVKVALQLHIPKSEAPAPKLASRAVGEKGFHIEFDEAEPLVETRSDGTTKLYNLWLFQFNADGSINGLPQKVSDQATAINDMVLIDVPLVVAKNQILYLLALGRQVDESPAWIRTFTELESFSFGYTTTKGGIVRSKITSEDDMPFAGYIKGVSVIEVPTGENRGQIEYNSPDGFSGGIGIHRLMSKVTLRYKFEVPGYKLEGLRLINANSTIRVTNPTKNDDTDTYISLEGEVSPSADADGFFSVTWFMAQNQQGDVASILTEGDRYYKLEENGTYSGAAPPNGTNIEAWAYSTEVGKTDHYAIYQMYLGKQSVSNFDVSPNTFYNIRTTINTDVESAKNDGRIRAYTAKLTTSLRASGSKKGPGNTDDPGSITGGANFDFDAHYDTRQIDIRTKGRVVSIGIYTDAECKNLADPATSWLKISSSKNYTEALHNTTEPLGTSVITDIIQLPTKLTFYLYNEEYFVDAAGKYFDYTQAETAKRRLYIWVKTTTEGVSEETIRRYSMIYYFDQRPAIYMGRMGGELTGMQYQTGICSEQIMESNIQYTEEKYTTSNSRPLGYYNQKIQTHPGYNGVRDAWNGRLATIQMVYNPGKLPVNLMSGGTNNFQNPQMRPDGHPMLYQYRNYNSYAARYCYDKNRDNNGNGYLDDNEIVWYLPAVYQAYGMKLWIYGNFGYNTFTTLTSTEIDNSSPIVALSADLQQNASSNSIRCIRDFNPANQTNERMYIYKDERGNQYGAIEASALPNTDDRSLAANPDIYETLPLYTYTPDGNLSEPILDDEGNKIYVKRLRRHVVNTSIQGQESINKRVSAHFLIASTHINGDGVADDDLNCLMPWADGMGYLATANTVSPEDGLKPGGSVAVRRGCPMYRGKDGQDPIGSWRVPTVREMMLMAIYFGEYNKMCATIDSKPFLQPIDGGGTFERNMYWMATETDANSAWSMRLFQDLNNLPLSTGSSAGNNKAAKMVSGTNYKPHPVRCIRDLPRP